MSDAPTINWPGQSGTNYLYYIYPIEVSLKASGGNYIFAKQNAQGQWSPVYIGQTNDLSRRLAEHANDNKCIERNGATHIHAHLKEAEAARLAEEKDLILLWQPPCNTVHVD